jgi:hypothetical protein
LADLIKILLDKPLLLDEFDIGQRLCGQFDSLNGNASILMEEKRGAQSHAPD